MKLTNQKFLLFLTLIILHCLIYLNPVYAQSAMINLERRERALLNGKWQVIIDPTGIGEWREVWKERKPVKKTDFVEYSFEGGPVLNVPGDFNTQKT